jgi:hypothetical protein
MKFFFKGKIRILGGKRSPGEEKNLKMKRVSRIWAVYLIIKPIPNVYFTSVYDPNKFDHGASYSLIFVN